MKVNILLAFLSLGAFILAVRCVGWYPHRNVEWWTLAAFLLTTFVIACRDARDCWKWERRQELLDEEAE